MIRMTGVSFTYHNGPRVLRDVDLAIDAGLTLLVGPNGCGKSTLSRLVSGIERPDTGVIEVGGRDLWRQEVAARTGLAYVPEYPDLTPYATVGEILRLVCSLRREPPKAAGEALERVGLGAHWGHSVRELSAGQRRRATLAAAMIGSTSTLVLDEPLETLDRAMRDEVLAWVTGRRQSGAVVLVVTHDIEPFLGLADNVISIRDGKVFSNGPMPVEMHDRFEVVDRLARGVD